MDRHRPDPPQRGRPSERGTGRGERLAAALRANLRRRKEQARARDAAARRDEAADEDGQG